MVWLVTHNDKLDQKQKQLLAYLVEEVTDPLSHDEGHHEWQTKADIAGRLYHDDGEADGHAHNTP